MGIRIIHSTGTGRARCRRGDCDRLIEQGELCVYAESTNVPQVARCAGYVCWRCFMRGLTQKRIDAQVKLERKIKAKNNKIYKLTKGIIPQPKSIEIFFGGGVA
jgi:hypothetical protein